MNSSLQIDYYTDNTTPDPGYSLYAYVGVQSGGSAVCFILTLCMYSTHTKVSIENTHTHIYVYIYIYPFEKYDVISC